jgi:hypothetical protein
MRRIFFGAFLFGLLPACLLVSPLDEATPEGGYAGQGGGAGKGGSSGGSKASGGSSGKGGSNASGGVPPGGSGGSAGSAGSGGGPTRACTDPLLIDDFEGPTHTSSPCATDGRNGGWYVYSDGTGMTTPPVADPAPPFPYAPLDVPRGASTYAVRVVAGGQTDWGGGFGVSMRWDTAYDASAYAGLRFWARGRGQFQLQVGMTETVDRAYPPGVCVPGALECGDHFEAAPITLTDSWQEYVITFASLRQEGWGVPAIAFDRTDMTSIEFTWALGSSLDMWVDDISFLAQDCTDYARTECPTASSVAFCSYGAWTTFDCPDLCASRGFSYGGNACTVESGCDCTTALDPSCEAGAVDVCYCSDLAATPCPEGQLLIEYIGCYKGVPEWDYVSCFGGYDPQDLYECADAATACVP